jgi:hypothetical protein
VAIIEGGADSDWVVEIPTSPAAEEADEIDKEED